MYDVSELFKTYVAQPNREMEVKVVIGAVTYDNTKVIEFTPEDSLIASDEFTIGTVIPSKLTLSVKTTDTIFTNAKITPSVRLNGANGWTEWVELGSYYIDNRDYKNGVWTFVCYDKLITTQQPYVSSLTYPEAMQNVFNEMVTQLGFTVDASVAINPAYMISYKDEDISMRDMFSYIASAHGCSIKMTKNEKLAFVSFLPGATKTALGTSHYFDCLQTNPVKTYTRILLIYNTDGETLESGTGDDDHTLEFYNPFMTQAMLDSVLAALTGFSYTPIQMDWKGFVFLEVGDAVEITLRDSSVISSVLLTNKATFKGGLKYKSTAPSVSAQKSEFNFTGTLTQQIQKAVKADTPYYGVTIGRANGIKVTKSNGITEAILNSDLLQFTKNGSPIFYFDESGDLQIVGFLTAAGLKNTNGDTLLSADGKLLINMITSLGQNPYILLFDDDPTGPAIDATAANMEGQGTAIRWKWDLENYLLISTDLFEFYMTSVAAENRISIQPDGIHVGSRHMFSLLTDLDFYSNGFRATYGSDVVAYTWTKDGSGRITQLDDVYSTNVIPITWNAGEL
ncbi:MAG: hypothetical protein NC238_03035 [Dehalobacter sp.]|nr:hypothetical protein [Dehalobacter sp.]